MRMRFDSVTTCPATLEESDFNRVKSALAASPKATGAKAKKSVQSPGDKLDPIGFDISPDSSYAKQLYYERHEGL